MQGRREVGLRLELHQTCEDIDGPSGVDDSLGPLPAVPGSIPLNLFLISSWSV